MMFGSVGEVSRLTLCLLLPSSEFGSPAVTFVVALAVQVVSDVAESY
jgi:hypothetical protein